MHGATVENKISNLYFITFLFVRYLISLDNERFLKQVTNMQFT
jgi:hypothetical protein